MEKKKIPSKKATLLMLKWFVNKRFLIGEIEGILQSFFKSNNKVKDSTMEEYDDMDYSFVFTTASDAYSNEYVTVEIYYLKTRNNLVLVTGAELVEYVTRLKRKTIKIELI